MTTTHNNFEQPVLLRQSPIWSRAIAWTIMGVSTFTLIWAAVFQIEEAIPATGKLEPTDAVKEVQAPISGVVKDVYVKDGQQVKAGDRLLSLDPTAAKSQLKSLQQVRTALIQENAYYRRQMAGKDTLAPEIAGIKIPDEMASLTKSRAAIVSENRLYRAQLRGLSNLASLSNEEQLRLQNRQAELNSRLASVNLDTQQAEQKYRQNQVELANAKAAVIINEKNLAINHDTLGINKQIVNNLKPLVDQGGFSRLQFLRQQQEVLKQQQETFKQQQELMGRQAQVKQLTEEQKRLNLEIAKTKQQLRNTAAGSQEELLAKITNNDKTLAEIDSQISKGILENQKKISEIDSQLSQSQLTLQYQEMRAPANGTVFELKASKGNPTPTQSLLKIVPDDSLIAKVYIPSKDIGFVKEGMIADVRIDSFPFHEYGDIKGELIWVGSDALPPEQIRPYYHFPAKIKLNRQSLKANTRSLPLQSGMSVSTNIKLRKRTILSIFSDTFMKQVDSLKFIR